MSAQPQPLLDTKTFATDEEYLAAERQAEFKHEYYQGEVVAMAGASNEHNLITGNLITTLNVALRDRDCTVRASDMRLQTTAAGLYSYPDVSVVCGLPEFRPDAYLDTLLNPSLLVEVTSKSTEQLDRRNKFMLYRLIPSLQYYLLVSSKQPEVVVYARDEGEKWLLEIFSNLAVSIPLPLLDIELPLTEVYRKVTFPPDTSGPRQ
ncbi:Uma2 family endonuclease [Hymenobacter weizhouensis]|uniref:Uma2 family endonuclease n=1 Tax=Hymenobacter sp. YIM 151500-1 TaxID=2987689 RepID=UPI002227C128|nr:Uma2 family endonuclease [Hymenobacter sp. YIM 151500-1]UYZ64311.1 Uma2 family endonuclease [Hymenobacter sp. YIM 151500-1]